MWILVGAVVTASLLGSMHCVGMCGPLALWASGSGERASAAQATAATSCYHLGRGITYTLAGALAGTVGGLVDIGGELIGIQLIAARIVGTSMILLGAWQLWSLFRTTRPSLKSASGPPLMTRVLIKLRPLVFHLPLSARGLITGLLTALLPCGWLYLFALVAAGTGDWLAGATVMAAFWLGTVPALVGLVIGTQSLAARFRKLVPAAVALLLIAGGCFTAAGRGFAQLESLGQIQTASQQVLESSGIIESQAAPESNPAQEDWKDVSQAVETLVNSPLPCCASADSTDGDPAEQTGNRQSEGETH